MEPPNELQDPFTPGFLLIGSLRFLNDQYCTTHWAAYDNLYTLNESTSIWNPKPEVVLETRFVDSGLNFHGVSIVTSGAVSCGIDATFHVYAPYNPKVYLMLQTLETP